MGSKVCSCLYHITSVLQVGLALAIIIIVAVHLQDVTYDQSSKTLDATCSLGTATDSSSLCVYTYAVAGISVAVSLAISILQCFTCNLCGLGKILDIIFSTVGTGWWVIAAAVITTNVKNAKDDPSLPQGLQDLQNWRTAVVVCSWVEVILFALSVVFGLGRCCGCGGSKDKK